MAKYSQILIFFFILYIFVVSCSSPKEGCLDITATNFDVSADDQCEDCCTYPTLKLTFFHQYLQTNPDTTLTFKYNTLYQSADDPNRKFLVDRVRFYISNFRFVESNGEQVGSGETIELESDSGTFTVEDNFALADRDIFAAPTIKNFIAPNTYNKIEFDIGLNSEIRNINPESAPDNHALDISNDSLLYDNSGYLSSLVIFRPDNARGTDSTIIKIREPISFSRSFLFPIEFIEGVNVNVQIQIDYNKWFENINIFTDSEAKIESQMIENLPNAFEILDIILE